MHFIFVIFAVKVAYGPMARDIDTLVLGFKSVVVPKMWELDPFVPRMPFDSKVHTLRLIFEGIRERRADVTKINN